MDHGDLVLLVTSVTTPVGNFTNRTNNVAGPTERGLLKRQTPGTSRHQVSGFGNYI